MVPKDNASPARRPAALAQALLLLHLRVQHPMAFRGIARFAWLSLGSVMVATAAVAVAVERRAPPPSFSENRFSGLFFRSAEEAIRGQRPSVAAATGADAAGADATGAVAAGVPATARSPATTAGASDPTSGFTRLISPASLEDEIKRVRLEFEATITTPAAFRSGDFQKARLHLTTLASLFAVIVEHDGDVRWKRDAAAARDLLARSAANCKSGSAQVYNEAKLRKADLEDLVGGSGLTVRQAESENDWLTIADRVPLMVYAETLLDGPLKQGSRNAEAVKAESDRLRRSAELLAVIGEILRQDGMADADDADYRSLCQELIDAGTSVSLALDQQDAAAVGRAVGALPRLVHDATKVIVEHCCDREALGSGQRREHSFFVGLIFADLKINALWESDSTVPFVLGR
jgi:hypothetical protein